MLVGLSTTETRQISHDPLPPRRRKRGSVGLPVVNEGGYLAGVITLDDIVKHVSLMMKRIGEVFHAEYENEARSTEPESATT